jgi:hypothetical protein
MTPPPNIFGLTRSAAVICGITLLMTLSLQPHERVWLQEVAEKADNEYNKNYLTFISDIQKSLKLETEEKAYHLIRSFQRGEIEDTELFDEIDLKLLKHPVPKVPNTYLQRLTYLINSRIIKAEFPKAEFKEAFGLEYKGEWTLEHTKAIAEISSQFDDFFAREINGGVVPEAEEGKTV